MEGFHPIADVLAFMEVGGGVLAIISLAIVAMWSIIFERAWYFRRMRSIEPPRPDGPPGSRSALLVRHAIMVRHHEVSRGLPMIRALIAVCPLLGLLGTVVGMIEVFEVTALAGTGNVRAIAAGVSRATVTTMAGLVAALSGLLLLAFLDRFVWEDQRRCEHALASESLAMME